MFQEQDWDQLGLGGTGWPKTWWRLTLGSGGNLPFYNQVTPSRHGRWEKREGTWRHEPLGHHGCSCGPFLSHIRPCKLPPLLPWESNPVPIWSEPSVELTFRPLSHKQFCTCLINKKRKSHWHDCIDSQMHLSLWRDWPQVINVRLKWWGSSCLSLLTSPKGRKKPTNFFYMHNHHSVFFTGNIYFKICSDTDTNSWIKILAENKMSEKCWRSCNNTECPFNSWDNAKLANSQFLNSGLGQ